MPYARARAQCDSMEVVGDMVQDLAAFLNVQQIDSVAHFPAELEHFREVLERVRAGIRDSDAGNPDSA